MVFVCGPEGMMDAVTAALDTRGFPASKVKLERFAASIPKHEHQPARVPPEGQAQTEVTVVLTNPLELPTEGAYVAETFTRANR